MKKKVTTILLMLLFAVGLSLLLYPVVSNYWNQMHASKVVVNYDKAVAEISTQDYAEIIKAANAYNQSLLTRTDRFSTSTDEESDPNYLEQLVADGSDVMGYVQIPKIDVKLPIYHGTTESVLQVGVGHIAGSSLPVGGESTHCALSGHTGLPSAKLLTDMDQLEVGDMFYMHILGNVLAYQVDQILIVEPDDVEPLAIVPGEDYVTLVTCTPYGINSHRLLVRGTRVQPEDFSQIAPTNDAEPLNRLIGMAVIAVPVFLLCLIMYLIISKRK
jgi:sortase A